MRSCFVGIITLPFWCFKKNRDKEFDSKKHFEFLVFGGFKILPHATQRDDSQNLVHRLTLDLDFWDDDTNQRLSFIRMKSEPLFENGI